MVNSNSVIHGWLQVLGDLFVGVTRKKALSYEKNTDTLTLGEKRLANVKTAGIKTDLGTEMLTLSGNCMYGTQDPSDIDWPVEPPDGTIYFKIDN